MCLSKNRGPVFECTGVVGGGCRLSAKPGWSIVGGPEESACSQASRISLAVSLLNG